MTLAEFLHMGGYGFYVWSSYALTLVVLAANLISALRRHRRLLRDLREQQSLQGGAA